DEARRVIAGRRADDEAAALAVESVDAVVERQRDLLARRDAAVVLERVLTRRLVVLYGKGIAADLDQVGRREELHVRRIAVDGVDQRALVEDPDAQAAAADFNGAGEADRPR